MKKNELEEELAKTKAQLENTDKALKEAAEAYEAETLSTMEMAGRITYLEAHIAKCHKALTVCDGAMMGKVKPSSPAFRLIREIMYPDSQVENSGKAPWDCCPAEVEATLQNWPIQPQSALASESQREAAAKDDGKRDRSAEATTMPQAARYETVTPFRRTA